MSDDMKKELDFHGKIVELQRVSGVEKKKIQGVSFKSRSLTDMQENIKPHLNRLELLLTITSDIISINNESYVKSTATISDREKNSVDSVGWALIPNATYTVTEIIGKSLDNRGNPIDDTQSKTTKTVSNNRLHGQQDPQVIGSCMSYAGKYALQNLLCIDENVDIDTIDYTEKKVSIKESEIYKEQVLDMSEEKLEPFQGSLKNAIEKLTTKGSLENHTMDSLNNQSQSVFKKVPIEWDIKTLRDVLESVNKKLGA